MCVCVCVCVCVCLCVCVCGVCVFVCGVVSSHALSAGVGRCVCSGAQVQAVVMAAPGDGDDRQAGKVELHSGGGGQAGCGTAPV